MPSTGAPTPCKERLVFAGLRTSVCVVEAESSAAARSLVCFVKAPACGSVATDAHGRACPRMIRIGARLVTSSRHFREVQRDRALPVTNAFADAVVRKFGGYGPGTSLARSALGAAAGGH